MATLGDVGAGHTLGRYELLTPIAQGGMALVWAARIRGSRNFQKIVAIKTMLPQLSDDAQFERMFLSEAELTARIKHPNVCEVLDLGEEDGTLYIVMEWVDGESLSTLMKAASAGGGIPVPIAVSLVRDAALGLHAAHELRGDDGELVGLVHRDVSPQNILVTSDGLVKIVDFGIAKATARADDVNTTAGQVKGKIPYMAPEQPMRSAVDRRTDVFALGTILHLMVTGEHPFRTVGDEMATLRRLCDRKPLPRASSVVPTLSPRLDQVIARALEKAPRDRFQSMAELADALDEVRRDLERVPGGNVASFVQKTLGGRLRKRKAVIQEALRLADARAGAARAANDAAAVARSASGEREASLPPVSEPLIEVGPVILAPPAVRAPAPARPDAPDLPSEVSEISESSPSDSRRSSRTPTPSASDADTGVRGAPRRLGSWAAAGALVVGIGVMALVAIGRPPGAPGAARPLSYGVTAAPPPPPPMGADDRAGPPSSSGSPSPRGSTSSSAPSSTSGSPSSSGSPPGSVDPSSSAADGDPAAPPADAAADPYASPSASDAGAIRAAPSASQPRWGRGWRPRPPAAPPANGPKVSDPGF